VNFSSIALLTSRPKTSRARLEAQFKDGITDLDGFERAIEHQLTMEPTCTPWRKSEIEQTGCREGMRIAALEFYWAHRLELRRTTLDRPLKGRLHAGAFEADN
jgi:hypothetical protein